MIRIVYANEVVTFHNVPHNVKDAIQTLLYNIEMGDADVISEIEEKESEEE